VDPDGRCESGIRIGLCRRALERAFLEGLDLAIVKSSLVVVMFRVECPARGSCLMIQIYTRDMNRITRSTQSVSTTDPYIESTMKTRNEG